ncbi:hypothetical protein ACFTXM_46490 [Streptomyces sp. NPDC056930]|uniref:hypothetical protein n=1 Tax=Streptomyces sp. NPDC056930 TaxID=3345967 RepID=UPI0036409192
MGGDVLVAAVAALTVGYLVGQARPWLRLGDWATGRLGDWAEDQVRFTGSWARGGAIRQAIVVLVHVLVRPHTSWRIMRTPATEAQALALAPVRDPDWVANRTRREHE